MRVPQDYTEEKKTGGFEPLPAGNYEVAIVSCEHRASKSGKMMYDIQMSVIANNRRLFDYVMTDESMLEQRPAAYKNLIGFLKAVKVLGVVSPGQEFSLPRGEELIGKVFWVNVGIDRNDPSRNKVWNYLSEKPNDTKSVLKERSEQKQYSQPTTGSLPPLSDDDEIPF